MKNGRERVKRPFRNCRPLLFCLGMGLLTGSDNTFADAGSTFGEAQERLFPQVLKVVAGLDYCGRCQPAREEGGVYYDFLEMPVKRVSKIRFRMASNAPGGW